jgi:hypothetical protein
VWDVLRGAGAGNGDKVALIAFRIFFTLFLISIRKVLDVTLSFFTALVAKDPGFLSDLANKSDLTATLFNILERNGPEKDAIALLAAGAGDAALKKLGVLRTEKPLVSESCPSGDSHFPKRFGQKKVDSDIEPDLQVRCIARRSPGKVVLIPIKKCTTLSKFW